MFSKLFFVVQHDNMPNNPPGYYKTIFKVNGVERSDYSDIHNL